MTFFLNSHLCLSRSLRSNENRGWILRLWPLKFCNHSWQFGSSPQKGKVDLCKTNGSKVLIYLTLLNFIFYCTLVSNAKLILLQQSLALFWQIKRQLASTWSSPNLHYWADFYPQLKVWLNLTTDGPLIVYCIDLILCLALKADIHVTDQLNN